MSKCVVSATSYCERNGVISHISPLKLTPKQVFNGHLHLQTFSSCPPVLDIPRLASRIANTLSNQCGLVKLICGVMKTSAVADNGYPSGNGPGSITSRAVPRIWPRRSTIHAWRKPSATRWTRILGVMSESQPVVVPHFRNAGGDHQCHRSRTGRITGPGVYTAWPYSISRGDREAGIVK